jgi:hypothetical protein
MTIKQLHSTLRHRGGYSDNVDLRSLVDIFHTKLFIIDVCAVFMFLLKRERFACRLLWQKIFEKCKLFFLQIPIIEPKLKYMCTVPRPAADSLPYEHVEPHVIIDELADKMLTMIKDFKSTVPDSSSIRVCLVIDGDALPAKRNTHQERSRKSFSQLKRARRLARIFLGKSQEDQQKDEVLYRFRTRFRGYAYGWIRWFPYLKDLLAQRLVARGSSSGFKVDATEEYSVVVAPYEADPTCVWLAEKVSNACIFSPDGDLQIYPFADKAPVYLKSACSLSFKSTVH